jgi:hypothetical protein
MGATDVPVEQEHQAALLPGEADQIVHLLDGLLLEAPEVDEPPDLVDSSDNSSHPPSSNVSSPRGGQASQTRGDFGAEEPAVPDRDLRTGYIPLSSVTRDARSDTDAMGMGTPGTGQTRIITQLQNMVEVEFLHTPVRVSPQHVHRDIATNSCIFILTL